MYACAYDEVVEWLYLTCIALLLSVALISSVATVGHPSVHLLSIDVHPSLRPSGWTPSMTTTTTGCAPRISSSVLVIWSYGFSISLASLVRLLTDRGGTGCCCCCCSWPPDPPLPCCHSDALALTSSSGLLYWPSVHSHTCWPGMPIIVMLVCPCTFVCLSAFVSTYNVIVYSPLLYRMCVFVCLFVQVCVGVCMCVGMSVGACVCYLFASLFFVYVLNMCCVLFFCLWKALDLSMLGIAIVMRHFYFCKW